MKFIKAAILIMTITLFLMYISGSATAQAGSVTVPQTREMGDPQTAVEQEGPSLPIPAAAQRAEDLAAASASSARAEILKGQQRVAKAAAVLGKAKNSGNQTVIHEAKAQYDDALRSLEGAIANSTGITIDEISAMRSSGMEWGEISYELGINPSALGLDHTEVIIKANEIEMATARDAETGLSVWHGTRFSGKGMGLDRAERKKGVERGPDAKGSDSAGDIIASIGAIMGR